MQCAWCCGKGSFRCGCVQREHGVKIEQRLQPAKDRGVERILPPKLSEKPTLPTA